MFQCNSDVTAQDHEGRTCVSHARSSGASVRRSYNILKSGGDRVKSSRWLLLWFRRYWGNVNRMPSNLLYLWDFLGWHYRERLYSTTRALNCMSVVWLGPWSECYHNCRLSCSRNNCCDNNHDDIIVCLCVSDNNWSVACLPIVTLVPLS